LNYLVKSPVEFVFVEVGSLSKTRPRELVWYFSVIRHGELKVLFK
jgi:hypothetical protein